MTNPAVSTPAAPGALTAWAATLLAPVADALRCPTCARELTVQRSSLATWSAQHPIPSNCALTYATWGYFATEADLRAAFDRGEGLRKACPERIALVQGHVSRLLLIVNRKKRAEG